MRYTLVLIFCVVFSYSYAQKYSTDTIIVMHYNTLNYGMPANINCPGLVTDYKHGYMRKIFKYADPDILGLVKMKRDDNFVIDSIRQNVFDSVCLGCYGHANYYNKTGFYKENLVYYKKSKFGFSGTQVLNSRDTGISDINIHKLYYKDAVANIMGDTVFLSIIQCHLLSGDSVAVQRGDEIQHTLDSLHAMGDKKNNYIFMGDFNSRTSKEPCIDSLINPYDTSWAFYDPSNQLGDWTNNPKNYAQWLTISTRAIQLDDCGSKGGMDGIYDHIFANYPLMNNKNGAFYIANSYKILGQDGLHVNAGLLDKPTNISAPKKVINSLYYMSNHLPVMMQIGFRNEGLLVGSISSSNTNICKSDSATITITGNRGRIDWQQYKNNTWQSIGSAANSVIVTPATNTNYRALVSSSKKSDSTNIISINILPAPNVVISPKTPANFCDGDSILLSVLTFQKYSWSNGDTSSKIYTSSTGTYWVQATGSNGCTATDTVQVIKIAKPDASFGMLPLTPIYNIQFTAKDSNLTSYNWDFGDTKIGAGKSVIHLYDTTGNYTVKLNVIDAQSCSNASSQSYSIIVTGLINISNINSVSINPNPYNYKTIIQYDLKNNSDVKMELTDISGKIIQSIALKNISAGTHIQEIHTQAAGIYILRVIAGGTQQVFKLMNSCQ